MDALALLCNLHADGPATLQRLRRSACDSLNALRRLDPAALAEVLDWNERAAERFLREASLLYARVQEEDAGRAEESEFELESALVEELEDAPDETETDETDEDDDCADDEALEEDDEDGETAEGHVPALQAQAVLGEWRELDRVAPPSQPTEFVIPRPAPAPDRKLDALELAGLSAELRARLAALGVHTLRELCDARELELVRALPLGFTRLKRLRSLAARALERLPPVPPAAPAPAYETYSLPPNEPFETAGPFA
jgi:hypothetical protein